MVFEQRRKKMERIIIISILISIIMVKNLMPELREAERERLLHFTTDMGQKEHTREAYITITAHWIKDYQMKSAVLGTKKFELKETQDDDDDDSEDSTEFEESSSM